jgi:hypothetical protein
VGGGGGLIFTTLFCFPLYLSNYKSATLLLILLNVTKELQPDAHCCNIDTGYFNVSLLQNKRIQYPLKEIVNVVIHNVGHLRFNFGSRSKLNSWLQYLSMSELLFSYII